MDKKINEVIDFWYSKPMADHWFMSTPEIDDSIKKRFEKLWEKAHNNELAHWSDCAFGCLALCIVLDQFPLNMFRGEAKAWSSEQQAVAICKKAVHEGFAQQLPKNKITFLLMPLMHSENLQDQDLSVTLFNEFLALPDGEDTIKFANHHRDIVRKFGRFPHRNALLGRVNTNEELKWLNSDAAFTG